MAKGVAQGREEGRLEGARRSLLLPGEALYGTPAGSSERASIEAINSLQQLDELTRRAPRVRSWSELLTEAPARSGAAERRAGHGRLNRN